MTQSSGDSGGSGWIARWPGTSPDHNERLPPDWSVDTEDPWELNYERAKILLRTADEKIAALTQQRVFNETRFSRAITMADAAVVIWLLLTVRAMFVNDASSWAFSFIYAFVARRVLISPGDGGPTAAR